MLIFGCCCCLQLLFFSANLEFGKSQTSVNSLICFNRPTVVRESSGYHSCIYYASTTSHWLQWYVNGDNMGGFPTFHPRIYVLGSLTNMTLESVYFQFNDYGQDNTAESFLVLTSADPNITAFSNVAFVAGDLERPFHFPIATTEVQFSDDSSDSLNYIKLFYMQELQLSEDNCTKTHILLCHSVTGSVSFHINETTSVLCKNLADFNISDDTFRTNNKTCFVLRRQPSETYNVTAVIIINTNFETNVSCSSHAYSEIVLIHSQESAAIASYSPTSTTPTDFLVSKMNGEH